VPVRRLADDRRGPGAYPIPDFLFFFFWVGWRWTKGEYGLIDCVSRRAPQREPSQATEYLCLARDTRPRRYLVASIDVQVLRLRRS